MTFLLLTVEQAGQRAPRVSLAGVDPPVPVPRAGHPPPDPLVAAVVHLLALLVGDDGDGGGLEKVGIISFKKIFIKSYRNAIHHCNRLRIGTFRFFLPASVQYSIHKCSKI